MISELTSQKPISRKYFLYSLVLFFFGFGLFGSVKQLLFPVQDLPVGSYGYGGYSFSSY